MGRGGLAPPNDDVDPGGTACERSCAVKPVNAVGVVKLQAGAVCRCDIAIEKLSVQNMSVNDVAVMLGFSEPRSFSRAFKQWSGLPPSAYRR